MVTVGDAGDAGTLDGGGERWWRLWTKVMVEEEQHLYLFMMPKSSVGKRLHSIWTSWSTLWIPRNPFRCNSVDRDSCIPAEFEFRSKFRRNHFINLAGPSAKIDSCRILGMIRIPAGISGGQ
jgi:hypothetical protein